MAAAFVILLACAFGLPLPGTLFLLALGSSVEQGDLDLREVLLLATGAAILGDQVGYLTGRVAGRRAIDAFIRRFERGDVIRRAEAFTGRWGAPGIFFSRWLITALGPWVNLSSGITAYSWPKFLIWDILGEAVWVTAYVSLGRLFHDRIEDLAELIGSIGWLLLALIILVVSGWELVRQLRHAAERANPREAASDD